MQHGVTAFDEVLTSARLSLAARRAVATCATRLLRSLRAYATPIHRRENAMSSPLHSAVCTRREGLIVEIELASTTGIGPHFPASEFFAFSLLFEAATGDIYSKPGVRWRSRPAPPLAAATSYDELDEFANANDPRKDAIARRYVARAAYAATKHWTPQLWTPSPRGFVDPGSPRMSPAWKSAHDALSRVYDAAYAAATRGRGLDEAARDASRPRATLRIELTDPAHGAHLEPGMLWDVYVYDDEAPTLL